ncbi:hypothetical protein AC482_05445 [miscellaneous Crenarchaeota group-15 archaeon DG-45]|uniref:DUF5658 domain-containing protein n=1 Tax=miscellaneous Crenarchaeota group-15 archaeon DG-45 TaxID=1685127 RepID=A0A0M0BMP7_9ARCH|nr:MAG: hypothetical protein AC482_05445 [miscellaneous Crenarchaeota group-15 archaeon DG-45]
MGIREAVAYIVLIIGAGFDQLSTRIGLACPHIHEVNPFARWLQANGLWLISDASVLVLLISSVSIILKERRSNDLQVVLLVPMIVGLFRLIIGARNLLLI